MIHRTIFGSLERFIGILVEHYAGKLPLWLAPVQVKILTVAERFEDYAHKVKGEYCSSGIRAEVDTRSETLNRKVREAQLEKIPYILVVGEKESAGSTVTVRTRDNEVIGARNYQDFMKQITKESSV
jgi:threonyl-tRNA synthetase